MPHEKLESSQQTSPWSAGDQEPASSSDPAVADSGTSRSAPEAGRLVPVAEAIKYRRRAQQAETRLQQVEQQLNDLQAQLEQRLDQLATAEAQRDEIRHQLEVARVRAGAERVLYEAGVEDIETAMVLLDKRVGLSGDTDADQLRQAIDRLIQDKPFLVGPPLSLPDKTASPRPQASGSGARLARAAARAARTGNRRDIVEYLRMRRQIENQP